MNETNKVDRPVRKVISLEEEIQKTEEKLRRLQNRQKEQKKKEKERNQKAIFDLIRSEKLDKVSLEQWEACISRIKELLVVQK